MSGRAQNIVKMRSDDRIIVLKPQEGKHTLSSSGMVDNRLFTGDNKLHAKLDKHFMLWSLQQEKGLLPQDLKQRWTSFDKCLDYVRTYFNRRNIDVVEVID
jgi:hypothetical protein